MSTRIRLKCEKRYVSPWKALHPVWHGKRDTCSKRYLTSRTLSGEVATRHHGVFQDFCIPLKPVPAAHHFAARTRPKCRNPKSLAAMPRMAQSDLTLSVRSSTDYSNFIPSNNRNCLRSTRQTVAYYSIIDHKGCGLTGIH